MASREIRTAGRPKAWRAKRAGVWGFDLFGQGYLVIQEMIHHEPKSQASLVAPAWRAKRVGVWGFGRILVWAMQSKIIEKAFKLVRFPKVADILSKYVSAKMAIEFAFFRQIWSRGEV